MGWWSTTVMGGDSPLDLLGDFADTAGAPFDTDSDEAWHCYAFTPENVGRSYPALVAQARNLQRAYGTIAGQVLGALCLWAGVALDDVTRAWVLDCAARDEWAAEGDEERQRQMEAFSILIESHESGRRIAVDDEGLFERLAGLS